MPTISVPVEPTTPSHGLDLVHLCKGGAVLDGIAVSMMAYIRATPWHHHTVIAILPSPYLVAEAAALGVSLRSLAPFSPAGIMRLLTLRRLPWQDVSVTLSWGHAANTLSRLVRRWYRGPLVWNLRDSGPSDRWVMCCMRLNRRSSHRLPDAIICVAEATMRVYAAYGYDSRRFIHITNGVDTARFQPSASARATLRQRLGVAQDAPLIGLAARYSPEKGFDTFLRVVSLLHASLPDARFLACGSGTGEDNLQWTQAIARAGLQGVVLPLGVLTDTPAFYAALDAYLLPTRGVDSANRSILEALSCGVFCISTDIGDIRRILAPIGAVTAVDDAPAMADAFLDYWRRAPEAREALGEDCRAYVQSHYTIEQMAQAYDRLFSRLAHAQP